MTILHSFLDLLFPFRCLACGNHARTTLCETCVTLIPLHTTLFCGQCRSRLPYQKKICHRDFPYLLGAATEFDHDAVRKTIHALKFRGVKSAAAILSALMARYVESLKIPFDQWLVVPLPLSRERLRERGFNQSEIMATDIGRAFGLKFDNGILLRTKHAPPQSEAKDRATRQANIKGCFTVSSASSAARKNILLIDDVCTSGSTLEEAAHALKNAGARTIIGLVAAKA